MKSFNQLSEDIEKRRASIKQKMAQTHADDAKKRQLLQKKNRQRALDRDWETD